MQHKTNHLNHLQTSFNAEVKLQFNSMKSCPFANIKIIKVAKGNLFKIVSVPVVRIIITRRLHKHEQFLCCLERRHLLNDYKVLLFGCIFFPLQVANSFMRCHILVSDATLGKSTSSMPVLDCPNCSHFIFFGLPVNLFDMFASSFQQWVFTIQDFVLLALLLNDKSLQSYPNNIFDVFQN